MKELKLSQLHAFPGNTEKLSLPATGDIIPDAYGHRDLVFDKLVWSVDDVARELSVSVRHVYKLISSDQIPFSKVGRLVRFSPVKITEWLQKGGTR